jgi:hypothetical protein
MPTGSCQCGHLRYEFSVRPIALYVCHCRECQKQSASAFGMSLRVPLVAFKITHGTPRTWTRPTDSGRKMDCFFCTNCGSRVWHQVQGGDVVSLKAGSLDDPVDLASAIHIWVSRKLAGVTIPANAKQFEKGD